MDQNLLKVFIITADCGSFEKACKYFYISATAIAKKIRRLENETNLTLFHRSKKGVTLTASGEIFYETAVKMLEISQDGLQKAQELEKRQMETVRMGVSLMNPCNKYWADRFHYSREFFVKFSLSMVPMNCNYVDFVDEISNLGKNIDIIPYFLGCKEFEEKSNSFPLVKIPFMIAMSIQHPLIELETPTFNDLENQTIITMNGELNSYYQKINEEILKKIPNVKFYYVDFIGYETFDLAFKCNYLILVGNHLNGIHPLFKMTKINTKTMLPYGFYYSKNPSMMVKTLLKSFDKNGNSGDIIDVDIVEM